MTKRKINTWQICLVALAVGINIVGGQIALFLKLPVYLDSIGTILTGALAGPWLGMIPIALFSVTEGFPTFLGGIAVVLLAQQIENLVVSPHVIGDTASLHPALVVLFLIAGGWLAGLPGMFYAIPAALSLRAALRALRDARLRI